MNQCEKTSCDVAWNEKPVVWKKLRIFIDFGASVLNLWIDANFYAQKIRIQSFKFFASTMTKNPNG